MCPRGSDRGEAKTPARYPLQPEYYQQRYKTSAPPYNCRKRPTTDWIFRNRARIIIFGGSFFLLVMLIFIIGTILSYHTQTLIPYKFKVETEDANWNITITKGSQNAEYVTLRIVENKTGEKVYSSRVNAIFMAIGTFYDMNNNRKLDAGDSILLYSEFIVEEGMKVELLNGDVVLGTIKNLPNPGLRESPIGLGVVKNSNGDWLITVASGGQQSLARVFIRVHDPHTGEYFGEDESYIHALTPGISNWGAVGNETGVYNDNNGDGKINPGDSILFYNTGSHGGNNLAGMSVELVGDRDYLGHINQMPA